MIGNHFLVTTATARIAAPSASRAEYSTPATTPVATGNDAPTTGKTLPEAVRVERLEALAEHLNQVMETSQRRLRFHLDEGSGRTVITVVNASTGAVVRQIPSDEALAIASRLAAGRPLIDEEV
jgi:flagellar protein FlaG